MHLILISAVVSFIVSLVTARVVTWKAFWDIDKYVRDMVELTKRAMRDAMHRADKP